MNRPARRLTVLVLCATGLAPVTAAQAQWGGASRPPPLYPHELQPGQSYAVEVAPGTYVIHRPSNRAVYPYVGPSVTPPPRRYRAAPGSAYKAAPRATPRPKRTHADRDLIEELRRRAARRAARKAAKQAAEPGKHEDTGRRPDKVINTRQIVREKPLVIETRRVVDDPPKVITRYHHVDDVPPPQRRAAGHTGSIPPKAVAKDDPRVIHADAEITILGPDRMSLRLIRKDGQRLDVNARAKKVK